jgi:hypothetical protein
LGLHDPIVPVQVLAAARTFLGSPQDRVSLRSLSFPRLVVAVAGLSLAGAQVLHESGHVLVSLVFGRGPLWGIASLVQLGDRVPLDPS